MYLVTPANLQTIDVKYLTGEVCLVDFDEAYHLVEPPFSTGIPEPYLPPEDLVPLGDSIGEHVDGVAAELWALGCTLFEIRMQTPLFFMLSGENEMLAEMVALFGRPHAELWQKWTDRHEYFDENGLSLNSLAEVSLGDLVSLPLQMKYSWEEDSQKSCEMDMRERRLFIDLLCGIMQFVPEKRASLDDILEHEWFKM